MTGPLRAEPARHEAAILAAGCALLHILLGIVLLTPTPYHGGDNGIYVALARSLLETGRYLELWDPAQRTATLYPPLFPLTLAGAIALGLKSWLQLKIVTLLISAGAVAVSVVWLRRIAGRTTALAAGLLLAISPGILEQSGYVLSEGLFWLFTMLALWSFSRFESDDDGRRMRWLIAAAAAAAAAGLTRSAGLPLIVAVVATLALRRRWRAGLIFTAISLPPLLLWSLRGRLIGSRSYGSYLTMKDPYNPALGALTLDDFVERVATNVRVYLADMAPSLLWGSERLLRPLLVMLVLVAFMWWGVRLFKKPGLLEIWVLLYTGLVAIWPQAWAGERFMLVLAPALIYYLADMVKAVGVQDAGAGRVSAITVFALTLVLMLPPLARRIGEAGGCREKARAGDRFACMPEAFPDFMEVAHKARTALPANAVVISRKPTLFFAESGLRSRMYPLSADTGWFFAAADSSGARYLVLDQLSPLAQMYLNPIVLSASRRFCLVDGFVRNRAVLLQILRTQGPPPKPVPGDEYVSLPRCGSLQ